MPELFRKNTATKAHPSPAAATLRRSETSMFTTIANPQGEAVAAVVPTAHGIDQAQKEGKQPRAPQIVTLPRSLNFSKY